MKLIQKLSSEVFFENIKTESNSRFLMYLSEFINGNKNEDCIFDLISSKKTSKIQLSLKTKSFEKAALGHLTTSYI